MLIASQTEFNQAGYLASDEARAQAALDAQIKHNSFRSGLPSMQVVEKEQKELLTRYRAGQATLEDLITFSKRVGYLN